MADYSNIDVFRAGLYRVLIHKNNSSGYAMGQFTDAEIADTTPASVLITEALVLDSITAIGAPGTSRITVSRFGGQQFKGRFDLGPGEFADFNLAFSDDSPSLAFLSNGAKVNTTTVTGVTVGGENTRPVSLNDLGGIFTVGAQAITRSTGAISTQFVHFWQPAFTLAKIPEELAGIQSSTTNPYDSVYNMAVSNSLQLQNGTLLTTLDIGVSAAFRIPFRSPYKNYALATAYADGTGTTFTLPRLPLFNTATTGGENYITKNGVPTAVTSVNVSTGVVTLAAAGSAGDIWNLWYPTADQS